ncbi:organic cation transporter protein-like [Mercenaria mercenaria]|uniref:organic cation transporter protein-like n=1 Tax=Mercenaria mercenaria TaxID=6596 RepID=UPI00234E4831|nr:organic cation transporter protein-like [Mercenaria mercenaria]
MKFDEVLSDIGEFGTYQRRLYVLVCLPTINCGIFMLISVFLVGNPAHRCAIPGYINDTYAAKNGDHAHLVLINRTIPTLGSGDDMNYDQCHLLNASNYDNDNRPVNASKYACKNWVYDKTDFEETLVSELNLVCDESIWQSVVKMMFFGGVLAGAFVFGMISDRIGRKKTLYISFILMFVTSVAQSWAPTLFVYILLRFLVGAAVSGVFLTAYVIGMEMVGPSMRLWTGTIIHATFSIGQVILAGVGYYIRDWRKLELVLAIPNVVYLTYYWLIPESPRWLLSKGRTEEAEDVLRSAAKVNIASVPQGRFLDNYEVPKDTGEFWRLFGSRKLIIRTLVIFFNWMVVAMVYYGLSLNAANLGADVYLNFLLLSLCEFPACVLCILLFNRIGRKKLHFLFMITGGIACIGTLFTTVFGKDLPDVTIALALIGKTGASGAFASIYVFSAELYPTTVRNAGIGASSCCARIGAMAAPYISDLNLVVEGDMGHALPMVVFGGASIVAGILTLLLPETVNRPLPETIEDAEQFDMTLVESKPEEKTRLLEGYSDPSHYNICKAKYNVYKCIDK